MNRNNTIDVSFSAFWQILDSRPAEMDFKFKFRLYSSESSLPEEWKNTKYGGSILKDKVISLSDQIKVNPLPKLIVDDQQMLKMSKNRRFGYFVFKNVLVMEYPNMDAFADIWQLCTDI